MACKKCGENGHYASTCGRSKKSEPKAPRGKAKRNGAAAPAALLAEDLPGDTVLEQLEARAQRLRAQIASVDHLQKKLETTERIIEDLRAIDGGA